MSAPQAAPGFHYLCLAQVHEIGGVIDISTMRGRADLICVVANAYQILHLMARSAPQLADASCCMLPRHAF